MFKGGVNREGMDYFIIKSDGRRWGPISLEDLNRAIGAKAANVPGDTMLEEVKTGSQLRASLVKGLSASPVLVDPGPALHAAGLRKDKVASLLFGLLLLGHMGFLVANHMANAPLLLSVPVVLRRDLMFGVALIGTLIMGQGLRSGTWACAVAAIGLVMTSLRHGAIFHSSSHALFAIPYAVMAIFCVARLMGYPKAKEMARDALRLPDDAASLAGPTAADDIA